jgi:hypothetical protein
MCLSKMLYWQSYFKMRTNPGELTVNEESLTHSHKKNMMSTTVFGCVNAGFLVIMPRETSSAYSNSSISS